MTIGIVIPTYNCGELLTETLTSVLAQTEARFRVVVVDDGSTEDQQPYVERATKGDERVTFVRKENGGVSSARNKGAELLGNDIDYHFFLDGDDLIFPGFLEQGVENLQSTGADLYIAQAERFEEELGDLGEDFGPEEDFIAQFPSVLAKRSKLIPSITLMKSRVWRDLEGFRDAKVYMEDWDFFLRAVEAEMKFSFGRERLAGYRRIRGSRGDRSVANRMQCAMTLRSNRLALPGCGEEMRKTEAAYWLDAARCCSLGELATRWRCAGRALTAGGLSPKNCAKTITVALGAR